MKHGRSIAHMRYLLWLLWFLCLLLLLLLRLLSTGCFILLHFFSSPHRRDTHVRSSSSFTDASKTHTSDMRVINSEEDLLSNTASTDSGKSTQVCLLHHPSTHTPYSSSSPVVFFSVDFSHNVVCAYDYTSLPHTHDSLFLTCASPASCVYIRVYNTPYV